jgi:hypothetical protein
MNKLNFDASNIFRTIFAILVSVLVLGTSVFAANYSNSLGLPPAGNPPSLVDESATYQEKAGGFWADAIGASDGFCIGNDCITTWPWSGTPATCQIDTLIKQGTRGQSGRDPGDRTPVGSGCTLSAAETNAGWILSAWGHCSWVSSADCAGPSWCKFTKLTCSGSVDVTPGTLYRGTPYYTQGYYEGGYGGDGGGDGGGCFAEETEVLMADGSEKKIADVRVGDVVMSADEVTGEPTLSTVTKTFEHRGAYATILVNGITVTPDHKFMILRDESKSWLPAGKILVGDSLITQDGTTLVTSVTQNEIQEVVYNLTTVPSHTYFAGGVLVHNVKDDGGGDGGSLE